MSDYAAESDWLEGTTPGILIELQLFWHLTRVVLTQVRGRSAALKNIGTKINKQFPDSKFNMLVRQHNSEIIRLGTT